MLFVANGSRYRADSSLFLQSEVNLRSWHGRCNDGGYTPSNSEDCVMLYWAAVFFVIALLAAIFGFGGLAASAAGAAKILFFVFLVFALVSFLFGRRSAA